MQLFENMYHAGAHQLVGGRLRYRKSGAQPIAVHFNGPAKVSFVMHFVMHPVTHSVMHSVMHSVNL